MNRSRQWRGRQWLGLAGWLALCYAVSGVSGFLTVRQIHGWYATLAQPPFTPPNWVFAPVWTTLYTMMAIAVWLVWRMPAEPARSVALQRFCIQLALNFAWSFLFFALHWILFAGIEVLLLWLAIFSMALVYARINRAAMWLTVPYVVWVGFASMLNWSIWWLNR